MVADFGDFAQRRFGIGDADGERRHRRQRRIEAEQLVERLAEIFADEIVKREVETGARGGRNAVVQQGFETVWVVGG